MASIQGTGDVGRPQWPTITEATDQLLSWFDTDDDGSIAVAEVLGVIDPGGHHPDALNAVVTRLIGLIDTNDDDQLSGSEVRAALTALDANGDGLLTPDDLGPAAAAAGTAPVLAAVLQGGPPAPPRAPTVDDVVGVLLDRFDANHDSSLTLAELLAVLDPQGRRARIDDALSALVGAVDADHDGSMSEAEVTAAVATLDTEGNGTLDHQDHVPGPPSDDAVDLIGLLLPRLREFDAATLGQGG